jgi:hypothetical protein
MAAVPDQITLAATTTNVATNVVISWAAPPSDEGSNITAYSISFLQANGSYSS